MPVGGSIIVTDNLPGNATTGFVLSSVTFSGPLTPACNTVANANSTRTLTCTYTAAGSPITRADLSNSRINVTGSTKSYGGMPRDAALPEVFGAL